MSNHFEPNRTIPEESLGDAHQARIRIAQLGEWFDKNLPAGREKALALTKLEEASHWMHAAFRTTTGEKENNNAL